MGGFVNGLNQYTAAGPAAFTYDANGNLTGDGTATYIYDVENRLVSANVVGQAVSLRYDPMGRLYETVGTATTRFLYDGDELVGEYDAGGAMLKRYVHGSAVDDPVIQYEGSGLASTQLRHLIADRQGSVIGLADSSGNIVARNTYDEYGIPKSDQGTLPVAGRFAYTGQIWLPELGMYHYKARLYSPTLGRFMQTDPIGYDDQINLYAYVGNDPVNWKDDSGTGKASVAKWFIEKASGGYKRVSESIARIHARRGGNVNTPGNGLGGRRMANDVYGKGNVKRDPAHPNLPADKKGHHQSHDQPEDRKTGGDGHIFHSSAATTVGAAAVTAAAAMRRAGDEIGTAEDALSPDASPLQRSAAKVWDFFDPASNIAEALREGADLLDPKKDQSPPPPCANPQNCPSPE